MCCVLFVVCVLDCLFVWCLVCVVRYSVFAVRCSLFAVRCLLFVVCLFVCLLDCVPGCWLFGFVVCLLVV